MRVQQHTGAALCEPVSCSLPPLLQVVEALQQTGAALITIHGRTMQQGYRKAADWDLIEQAAAASTIPIVGNGDVLTYYEVGTPGCVV